MALFFFEELDNDYTFAVVNNSLNGYLSILINESETYFIYYAALASNMTSFLNVSDKLKNQTE